MTTSNLQPRDIPCPTCPYRQNCPSGVWHESEYQKLPRYDEETAVQPFGVFMCHDAADNRTMCRGWLDVHDKEQSLSLRLAASMGDLDFEEIVNLPPSGVPVFASGAEAAAHGKKDIQTPGPSACKAVHKLSRKKRRKPSRKKLPDR